MSLAERISNMVRAALPQDACAFRPEPSAPESEAHCQALLDLANEQLSTARAEHERAAGALEEAEAAAARVRSIVDAAGIAEQDAGEAEAREREAARAWAASGAAGDRPIELRTLAEVSRAARRRADDAAVTAAGAREALGGLREAEEDARLVLGQADEALRSAVVDLLVARIEPQFIDLARARDAYLAARAPVVYLRHLIRNWGPAHPLHGFGSINVAAELDTRLRELAIESPTEPDIIGGAHDVLADAKRLLADAEAK